MILGNKCDLSDSRMISKERGQLLANEYGLKFMEISAKDDINVTEVLIMQLCQFDEFIQVSNSFM